MIERILVPTDFSASSRVACARAEEIARCSGAELLVLHVGKAVAHKVGDQNRVLVAPEIGNEQAAVRDALASMTEQLQARGIRARSTRVDGVPHEQILEAVASEKIDLVVMGTHGRRGLTRLVLGSVAERVLRGSRAPVMICQAGEQAVGAVALPSTLCVEGELDGIRTILVPTDLEPSSEGAVRAAFELAALLGATVHLLHAYPSVVTPGASGTGSIPYQALNRNARERLHEVARLHEGSPHLGKCLAVMGEPGLTIVETATELKADLIVVGTHGRTGLKRAFLGSVAEDTVGDADCAVLIVKSGLDAVEALTRVLP